MAWEKGASMSKVWMVRSGRHAANVDEFLDEGYIGVGFLNDGKPVDGKAGRKELTKRISSMNPTWSASKVGNAAGQLFRFCREIKVGDQVVTYDPNRRRYLVGSVTTEVKTVLPTDRAYHHQREVTWTHRALRDSLSVASRNTLGAIQSLFLLNENAAKDVLDHALELAAPEDQLPSPKPATPSKEDATTLEDLREEVVEKASEFIEDMIAKLDPYEMEELVAGILRAMGYKTRITAKGADRGVDIFASPDGLGLQEPRIFVEVKHRPATSIGAPLIRSFIGGRQPGDKCLYISTGGFSKEAFYEAERSNIPLSLLGTNEIKDLLIDHYESLDMEAQRIVPLTKIYWPTPSND